MQSSGMDAGLGVIAQAHCLQLKQRVPSTGSSRTQLRQINHAFRPISKTKTLLVQLTAADSCLVQGAAPAECRR